mmetsp:Transcript_6944/g.7845  ORF Transcript_6944/g.7845 Transcript_6944/m.7845 type:complete len:135 (+) Transcript_6944:300-704(+)
MELISNNTNLNVNQSSLTADSNLKAEKFLPYMDTKERKPEGVLSQRAKRNLTAAHKSAKKETSRSPEGEEVRNKTPRYNNRNVRLIKSKNQFVNQHKKSVHYNDRSRHVKSTGLRSNIKPRSSQNQKLITSTNI